MELKQNKAPSMAVIYAVLIFGMVASTFHAPLLPNRPCPQHRHDQREYVGVPDVLRLGGRSRHVRHQKGLPPGDRKDL